MDDKNVQNVFQWKNVGHQYYATLSANLMLFGHGCIAGWIAPALPLLLSDNTPLKTGPLTTEEASWIGSINCVGGLCGTLSFSYFTAKFGCKRTITFLAVPSVIVWLVIYFGDSYLHILFARLFGGYTGGAIQVTNVLFIAEIANDSIRGRLASLSTLSRNLGILASYIAGAYLSYEYIPCVFIMIPIVYVINFVLCIPNTPQYHLKNEQFQKAEKSLKYYKGYRGESEKEKAALDAEFERIKSIASDKKADEKIHWKDLCETNALKGLGIGIMLAFLVTANGGYTFSSYVVFIFERSGSHIDPYVSAIIVAIVQLIGSMCTTQLADTLGRKLTLLFSILGCAIGLSMMSAYLYLIKLDYDLTAYAWLPVTSLSFVIFNGSAGINSLCNVCIVENLPPKLRSTGLTIISIVIAVFLFTSSKFFPVLVEQIGLDNCLMIFAIGCFVGAIFIVFVMKETKGISIDTTKPSSRGGESNQKSVP